MEAKLFIDVSKLITLKRTSIDMKQDIKPRFLVLASTRVDGWLSGRKLIGVINDFSCFMILGVLVEFVINFEAQLA